VITDKIDDVIEKVLDPKIVFFVGAGLSASSIGTSKEINRKVIKHVVGDILSIGEDEVLSDIRPEVLLKLLTEEYSEVRDEIFRFLVDTIKEGEPNENHFFLAEVIKRGGFVFTTNYDTLIEDACCDRQQIANYVCYQDNQFKQFCKEYLQKDSLPKTGRLFKLHRSVESPDSILATLSQLGGGLSRYKKEVLEYFLRNFNFCFMGYSCRDDFDILPVLLETPSKKGVIWFKYARETIGGAIWDEKTLRIEKEKEENKHLKEKKDWETININNFLLKRQDFLKIIGDPGQLIREILSASARPSKEYHTSLNRKISRGEGHKQIDYFVKNLIVGRLYLYRQLFNEARHYFGKARDSAGEDESKKATAQRWVAKTYLVAEENYNEAVKILEEVLHKVRENPLTTACIENDIAENLMRMKKI
jgi:tetratricopeptide (TPR) repeat protein